MSVADQVSGNGNRSGTYFAAEQDLTVLGDLIMQRQRAWQGHMRATGRLREIRDSHSMYYGRDRDFTGSSTRRVTRRKKGEVLDIRLNHFAALIRSIVTLTTAQEPAWEPKAENTDSDAQAETILATNLLEDYRLRKDLRRFLMRWVAMAIRYDASYLSVLWDDLAGPDVKPVNGVSLPPPQRDPNTLDVVGVPKEGDCVFRLYSPLDVAFDFRVADAEVDWRIYRGLHNRFQLAARMPDQPDAPNEKKHLKNRASAILSVDTDSDFVEFRLSMERRTMDLDTSMGSDIIPVYDFWHERSPALPNGRHVQVLSDGTVLLDEQLDTDEVTIYRLAPEDYDDTPHGHTVAFDLQGVQQAIDQSASYAMTKSNASLPRMIIQEASNLTASDLSVGMGVMKMRGGKDMLPTILTPSGSGPKDDIEVMGWLQKQAETISGVNSVVRGNPEQALKDGSGAALSLIQAQAYLNNTQLQGNFSKGLGKVGSAIVRWHQLRNKYPRKLEALAGKGRAQSVNYFVGDDIRGISRVIVQAGSAQTQSIAFRMQLLESLMKIGVQLDPQRLIAFAETGKWETVIEDPSQEDLFIRSENEAMRSGQDIPPAVWTENPKKHVVGHMMGVLNSLEAKGDPKIVMIALRHIQSHLASQRQQAGMVLPVPPPMPGAPPDAPPPAVPDPYGLMLLGYPLPPPPPPPPGMLLPPGAGPGGPPPAEEHKPKGKPPPIPPTNGPGGGPPAQLPHLPTMPNGQPTSIPGVT